MCRSSGIWSPGNGNFAGNSYEGINCTRYLLSCRVPPWAGLVSSALIWHPCARWTKTIACEWPCRKLGSLSGCTCSGIISGSGGRMAELDNVLSNILALTCTLGICFTPHSTCICVCPSPKCAGNNHRPGSGRISPFYPSCTSGSHRSGKYHRP